MCTVWLGKPQYQGTVGAINERAKTFNSKVKFQKKTKTTIEQIKL